LTPKQTALAESLVTRASAPPAARTDGLDPIVEMLALAGTKLKWPVPAGVGPDCPASQR
jgi:hypothetical protein